MTARQPYCKSCGHPSHRNDCGVDDCGCVKYVPRPPRDLEKLRTWIVAAAFLVKNRWVEKESASAAFSPGPALRAPGVRTVAGCPRYLACSPATRSASKRCFHRLT